MSLFDQNIISKDLSQIEKAKNKMIQDINYQIVHYVNDAFDQYMAGQLRHVNEAEEMRKIQTNIIYCWNWGETREFLESCGITGTSTSIKHSDTEGFKYTVNVDVRLKGMKYDQYVNILSIDILSDQQRMFYDKEFSKQHFKTLK